MLDHLNMHTINKKRVLLSTLFIPLAIPLFGLLLGINDYLTYEHKDPYTIFNTFLAFLVIGIIAGIIYWAPTIFFIFLLEYFTINQESKVSTVWKLLVVETIFACLIFSLIFVGGTVMLCLAIILTQFIRWMFIRYNNKIYTSATSKTYDEMTIDND